MSNNIMKNADMPAMPAGPIDTVISFEDLTVGGRFLPANGLTKREMFAMHAMQGITSNEFGNYNGVNFAKDIAELSVKLADALLAELEK